MRILKICAPLLLFAAIFTLLSGCSRSTSHAVAFVWGYHKNAPKPDNCAKPVENAVDQVKNSCGTIAIVVNDGDPFTAATSEAISTDDSGQEIKEKIKQIEERFAGPEVKAKTSEVNTLAAINLAVRWLADQEGEKQLYIWDSGLSTTGELNFRDGWLQQDSKAALAYLQENQALPNLNGIDVTWIGLGDVGGEQEPLSAKDRNTLQEIWNCILTGAYAEKVDFAQTPPSGMAEDYNDLPHVTPIDVETAPPPTTEPPAPTSPVIERIRISFKLESATFKDEDETRQALASTVELLQNYPQCSIVLVGITATDEESEDSGRGLSRDRAEAVQNLLLELGVAESQIAGVRGLGHDNNYHVPDVVNSDLIENLAEQNRVVLVLDAASPEAQNLLSSSQP